MIVGYDLLDGCRTTEGTTTGIAVGATEAIASRGTRTTMTTAKPYLGRQRRGGVPRCRAWLADGGRWDGEWR